MEKIAEAVSSAIREFFGVDDFEVTVSVAPENSGADFATNAALKLAKRVEKSPMDTALGIVSRLALDEFEVAVAAPGFINFISRDDYLKGKIADFGRNFDKNISQGEYSGKTVVCEFSDPNPFKVLHVGHLYTSIMGEAISRLIENAGGEVHRVNFGGDVGLHVAKTIWALMQGRSDILSLEDNINTSLAAGYHPDIAREALISSSSVTSTPESDIQSLSIDAIAKAYVEGSRAYEEDETAKAEIVKLNKEIYDIALHDKHDSGIAEIYWRGREISYKYFDDFYAKIGVKFEKYYPESTVAEIGLKKVRSEIGPVYTKSDGAVIFRGEDYGLHTRVFINKEGLPTYEAKDTGLIFAKDADYHFDESVVITGNDIIEYMKVVLKSISLYAPDLVEKTRHITHGNVRLAGNEKMSSRKGNFLKAVDVLEMVRSELESEYGSADEKVVMAAVKYAFLKYKIGGDIIFDPKESVSMTGNSGPYILYSVVRANKILSHCRSDDLSSAHSRPFGQAYGLGKAVTSALEPDIDREAPTSSSVTAPEEHCRNLSKKLLRYSQVLTEATKSHAPHILCNYLFEMAQEFSRFYENVKVAGSEQEAERRELVQIFVQVMTHGLNLLGIEVPEEM